MLGKCAMAFMILVIGGIGSNAAADRGDVAYERVQALMAEGHNNGHTAGTILNPEGRGDVLIFPYYDVREVYGKGQNTLFTIINDDSDCEASECNAGMAARLRFREASKGEEVFSTDIWLSRGDVWVGVITHDASVSLPYGARIMSPDWVITGSSGDAFVLGTPFNNGYDFPNTFYVPAGSSNLMGYFEVIGQERTYDRGTSAQMGSQVTRLTGNADAPNHLMGTAYIVRVADGLSFAYNATAVANFSRNKGSLFSGPNSPSPTLMDCEDTLDQLEFPLSKKEVFAGYSVEDSIGAKFSLIITFPTKNFHFCGKPDYTLKGDPSASCAPTYPLGSPFNPTLVSWVGYGYFTAGSGAGEQIDLTLFDRDQYRAGPIPPCFLSACPLPIPPGLPWGLNMIGLYPGVGAIPGQGFRDNVAFYTGVFQSGFIGIIFPGTGHIQPLNPKITKFQHFDMPFGAYEGMPVIGVALQEFQNSNVGGFYGDTWDVFYKTKWVPD